MSSLTSVVDPVRVAVALSSTPRLAKELLTPAEWAARSLFEVLSTIPDARSRHGRRHPLRSLLALLVVGFCCGANQVKAAVIFGRERKLLRRRLGFTHKLAPSQSTYSRLFQGLDFEAFQKALSRWLHGLVALRCQHKDAVLAVDGKSLRATGHHVLHLFVHDLWWLLDLKQVGEKQNELSAFREQLDQLLNNYPFLSLLTFDALFAQRDLAQTLTADGRRGLFQIKDNQSETLARLERWFYALPKAKPHHQTTESQGDHIVTRSLWVVNAPHDVRQLWPQARQIIAVTSHSEKRRPQAKDRADELHLYLLTGPKGQRRLSPKHLARLIRKHWGIENRLHHVLDRTFREDEQRLRVGCGALLTAWLRRLAVGLLYNTTLRKFRGRSTPEKRHILCAAPLKALKLIMGRVR